MQRESVLVVPVIFIILLVTTGYVSAFSLFNTVKITKVQCHFNPDWVQNGTCKLKAVNRHRHEVSVKGFLKKPMDNFWVFFKTYKLYNVYRPFIFSCSLNLCNYYKRNAKKDFLLTNLAETAQTFTNLNHSCPYEGWILLEKALYTRNYSHIVLPSGKYRADIKVANGPYSNPAVHGQVFVEVIEDTES